MSDQTVSRSEQLRRTTRQRLVAAARIALSYTGEVTPQLIGDLCAQTALHPAAFRTFFPTDDSLLDAVNDVLVEECVMRLRGGVARFVPPEDPSTALEAAAYALVSSWPIERGGVLIRARRRVSALAEHSDAEAVVAAEKRFVGALSDIHTEVLAKVGRRFTWSTSLAVRVILDTYERSFEAWLLGGHDEGTFETSPYARRTLPTLLREMSEPIA